ncbi:hypothetical protein [Massilia sp. 9096]|uniref:hypothetical protein n=1 Tax=Massilia sp. 9096 TaxID=1500894 RepID=UPI0012E050D8|nr:hypothetical protein [Massilia sp. 9096]
MNLIEAVQQRHLLHWHDRGLVRSIEPHAFALFPGGRLVIIGFQVRGGPNSEPQSIWRVIDASDGISVDSLSKFSRQRIVPSHLLSQICQTLALPYFQ